MARIIRWLVVVPLAAAILLLANANRRPVLVSFDPFRPEAPAYSVDVPLYIVLIATLALGVLIGGVVVWIGQGRYRRAARRAALEAMRRDAEERRALASHPQARAGDGFPGRALAVVPARRSA